MLTPKEIAQHDGIRVLGSDYLSTSCVKGQFINGTTNLVCIPLLNTRKLCDNTCKYCYNTHKY